MNRKDILHEELIETSRQATELKKSQPLTEEQARELEEREAQLLEIAEKLGKLANPGWGE